MRCMLEKYLGQGVGCCESGARAGGEVASFGALQESLLQQENALGRGYSDVLAELATKAAQARAA